MNELFDKVSNQLSVFWCSSRKEEHHQLHPLCVINNYELSCLSLYSIWRGTSCGWVCLALASGKLVHLLPNRKTHANGELQSKSMLTHRYSCPAARRRLTRIPCVYVGLLLWCCVFGCGSVWERVFVVQSCGGAGWGVSGPGRGSDPTSHTLSVESDTHTWKYTQVKTLSHCFIVEAAWKHDCSDLNKGFIFKGSYQTCAAFMELSWTCLTYLVIIKQ